jgi:hypothetical protein
MSNSNLFLSIGSDYDITQISRLYTRLMRDEVLAEFANEEDSLVFRVYCHISGGFVFGTARFRYNIFQSEKGFYCEINQQYYPSLRGLLNYLRTQLVSSEEYYLK